MTKADPHDLSSSTLAQRGWRPSKFELHNGHLRSSRKAVPVSSRLMADLAVANYEVAIREHARGRLADLGCGNAPLAGLYAPLAEEFLWVDWPGSPHQSITPDLFQDLNEPLQIADRSLDTVLLTDVLEHIRDPDALIGEVQRVLRPGGRAIIGVPFLYWLHEEPYDYHRYSRHKMRDFAARHGFEILSETENGGGFDVVRDLLTKMTYSRKIPLPGYATHYGLGLIGALLAPLNRSAIPKMPMGYTYVFGKK